MRRSPSRCVRCVGALAGAAAQDKGALDARSRCRRSPIPTIPSSPAKEVFGRAMTPAEAQARSIGFYSRGCLAGAVALPVDGESLAGDAPVAQPRLGPSGDDRLPRALLAQGGARGRLAGHSGRRHFAAARRADADRPRFAPDRPRRRRVADADARPSARPRRARRDVGRRHGAARRPGGRPARIGASGRPGSSRRRPRSPRSSASSSTRRSRRRLCETHKGEAWMNKVRPYWGHNYHFHIRIACPAGETDVPAAGPGSARRRLRQVARLVVHRRGAASRAGQAQAAADAVATAAGMPSGGAGRNSASRLRRRALSPPTRSASASNSAVTTKAMWTPVCQARSRSETLPTFM